MQFLGKLLLPVNCVFAMQDTAECNYSIETIVSIQNYMAACVAVKSRAWSFPLGTVEATPGDTQSLPSLQERECILIHSSMGPGW